MRASATALYPFVPSGADFRLALAFLGELGFATAWERDGYAGLRWGGAHFILQSADIPEWQTNMMVVIEVDDLDGYWVEIQAKGLAAIQAQDCGRPPISLGAGRCTSSTRAACAGTCGRQAVPADRHHVSSPLRRSALG